MVRAVIFDIDGTIIDSAESHIQAWNLAFQRFGKQVPLEAIRRQLGKDADEMLPLFFSKEELDRFREDLEKYRGELFRQRYLPELKAFPKVRELFERIKGDDKKIALASSAKPDELKFYEEIAHIGGLVDAAACSEEVKKSKPHPDVCAQAIEKLGDIPSDRVVAVGDTAYDAVAASKLNLRFIGLLCGGGIEEELRRCGAAAIYQSPADLLTHYGSSLLGLR